MKFLPRSNAHSFRKLSLTLLCAACFQGLAMASQAGVIFTETFSSATESQVWNGYNGWTGDNNNQIIIDERGTFVADPNTQATMQKSLGTAQSVSASAYRLSIDIQGTVVRPFLVMLGDANNDRVGLELGYSSSGPYGIGGVFIASTAASLSGRVHYSPNPTTSATNVPTSGGYYDTAAPTGWSASTIYNAHIDINGTDQDVVIGDQLLGAGKIRVVYNTAGAGGMATYTTVFDLPDTFTDVSSIQIAKVVGGAQSWSVDNLVLTSYAVPEPSAAALATGSILLLSGSVYRKLKRSE